MTIIERDADHERYKKKTDERKEAEIARLKPRKVRSNPAAEL